MKAIVPALLFLAMAASWFACDRNDDFTTDGNVKLEFSLDTLHFDTVFTELGSATRLFKVYNRNNRPVRISHVELEGGPNSPFRMNVDGRPGEHIEEVEVWANDSIYVFVEVTIDPNQPLSVSPFVIEEKIVFETNGNLQEVRLEAWGQNANYFPNLYSKGVPVQLTCNNGTIKWDDPKPYVIYGEVFIDDCTLEIAAGTRIYVHGGIARNDIFGIFNDGILYTLENGALKILGTQEAPVVIQGDRLEEGFQDESGQWNGIFLGKGSKGNVIQYTTIKNSIIGVYVDSTAELTISNAQIYNTASSGLLGFHSSISAQNCLIYNCGANSVQFIQGGDYRLDYCTIVNYGVNASSLGMSNYYCYDDPFFCNVRVDYPLNAYFRNCIIFGSRRDAIELADVSGGQVPDFFKIKFENCVVRVDQLLTTQGGIYAGFLDNQCLPCINGNRDTKLFIDPNEYDYHLDSLSVAIDQAIPIPGIDIDLVGIARGVMPDVGCYEK